MNLSEAIIAGSGMMVHERGISGMADGGVVVCGCATTMAAVACGYKPEPERRVITLGEMRRFVNLALDDVLDQYVPDREQTVGGWVLDMNDGREALTPLQIANRLAARGL